MFNVCDDKTACINGLLCADIFDHIPIFHIHKLNTNENFKENKKVKRIRKYDKHAMESFIRNLDCTDWRKCKNNEDPYIYYNNFIKKFTEIHNETRFSVNLHYKLFSTTDVTLEKCRGGTRTKVFVILG